MANAYTNAISDNVKRSIIYKLNNGECIQRAPVGYLNVRDEAGKSIVIVDKSRAMLIQEIFRMYATGSVSFSDLANFAKMKGLTNSCGKRVPSKTLAKNVIAEMLKNPFYYGEMYVKKYNKLYPHKYESLITKALFDECQRNMQKRSTANNQQNSLTYTKKEFVFKGLIKCAITGRTVTSDRKEDKTNKNTYLIVWSPENQSKKIFVPESLILSEVANIFKAISVPNDMLLEITARLQQSHESEKEYHAYKIAQLKKDS